jgi:hypothetical protein
MKSLMGHRSRLANATMTEQEWPASYPPEEVEEIELFESF